MAKHEPQELTSEAFDRITRVVRSMADDQIERGVELTRAMHCDSCGSEKTPAGSALYGAYRLCNDCLLEFTLALAAGTVDSVAAFMVHKPEDSGSLPPAALADGIDRTVSRPMTGRDKLRPSNEPV